MLILLTSLVRLLPTSQHSPPRLVGPEAPVSLGNHGPLRCHPCRTSGPRLTGRRDGWAPCVAGESFAQKEASIWVIRELDVYAYMEKKRMSHKASQKWCPSKSFLNILSWAPQCAGSNLK